MRNEMRRVKLIKTPVLGNSGQDSFDYMRSHPSICNIDKMIILILIYFIFIIGVFGQLPDEQIDAIKHSMTLQIIGSNETTHDRYSNITVTKAIRGVGEKIELKYIIRTPQVDDFDFVIALDSSGNMGLAGDPDRKRAIDYAIPRFIEDIINLHPNKNIKISILSWDDNIDFAYGENFSNNDPKKAKLIPIQKAKLDIMKNPIFGGGYNDNYFYKTSSNEIANISTAIEGAIDIFENNPPNYNNRTSRFIILVVSNGVFLPCNKNLIQRARDEGYQTYAILMDPIEEEGGIMANLKELTVDKRNLLTCRSVPEELRNELLMHLDDTLAHAISEPVIGDIIISESFYSYLHPSDVAMVETVGKKETYEIKNEIKNQNNGITTVNFRLPFGLLPDTTTEVTLYLDFILTELPASIGKHSEPIIISQIGNETPRSSISYTWLNSKKYMMYLPEDKLGFKSVSLSSKSLSSKAKALKRLLFD